MRIRRRHVTRAVALALAGVAVGGLLVGALRSPAVEGAIAWTVEREASRALREDVQVGRASVTFFPPGVALTGVAVLDDATGALIGRADLIHAPLVLRDGTVKLGQIAIEEPWLHLHIEPDGRLREFRAPAAAPRGGGRPLTELPFHGLMVRNGEVRLSFPEGEAAVSGLEVRPVSGAMVDLDGRLDVAWRRFRDGGELRAPGLVLGPEVIQIPKVELPLFSVQLAGGGRVPLAGELDLDLTVTTQLPALSPLLAENRFLEGDGRAAVRVSGPLAAPKAEVQAHLEAFAYDAPGVVWPRLRYTVDAVDVSAAITREEIRIDELIAVEDGGRAHATGVIRPVDTPEGRRFDLVEGKVHGEDLSLAALLRALGAAPRPWVDFTGDCDATVSGPLHPLRLEGNFEVRLSDFRVRQGPVDDAARARMLAIPTATLSGDLLLERQHIVLAANRLVTPRNRGSVRADIGFGPQGPLDLSVDLTTADLGDLRPLGGSELQGRGQLRGTLRGPFNGLRAEGAGTLRGFSVGGIPYADVLEASVASDMRALVLPSAKGIRGETEYLGTFSMDFTKPGLPMDTDVLVTRGRVQDLTGMFVDLGDLVTGEVREGTLVLSGPLNNLDGEAVLALGAGTLAGESFETGSAAGRMHQGTFTLDGISLRRGTEEGVDLRGSVGRDWALNLEGNAELRLERMNALAPLGGRLRGRATALFRVDNTLLDPAPHGQLRVWDVTFDKQSLADSVVLAETTNGILLAEGELVGGSIGADATFGLWGEQPYTAVATFQDFHLDQFYPVAADGGPVEARMSGWLEMWGNAGPTPSPVEVRGIAPSISLSWGRHQLKNREGLPWTFVSSGPTWSLQGVSLEGGSTSVQVAASGDEETLDLDGAGRMDADLLRAVTPGLSKAQGQVDLTFVSTGRRGSNQTRIDVTLDAPLLRHESVPEALEDVAVTARIGPDGILVSDFRAESGGGRITGDALRVPRLANRFSEVGPHRPLGWIDSEAWVPQRFDLVARAEDVQMRWVEDLPPATGDAAISFDGPADGLLLHADVDVQEMAFTERIDWEDWVVEVADYLLVEAPPTDESPWFGLDIDIRADRTIRLLNNVSDATASADLQIVGDTSRMGLLGRVRVEDGVVYVQDRAFDVERGELRFDDPYSWDPLLDFDLRADIQSRARQYRVAYRIGGPYSAWTSRTTSEPRLPQADINALLWFGVTADDLEDMGELTSALSLAAADFIFKDFVRTDYLGLGLRDASPLFERLPEIDLNTGVNLRGEYSSEPRLLLKQRFSPTLSVQGEVNLIRNDHFVRVDWRADQAVVLSAWWATRRRQGLSLFGEGALGADLRLVKDFD